MIELARRFSRHHGAVFGSVILLLVVVTATAMPIFYPVDPWQSLARPMLAPFEDRQFMLGTDMLGRDVVAGLIHGARISVLIGITATLMAVCLGISIGAVSGFYGGWLDDFLMRVTEIFQTLPTFVLAIVLVALFQPSIDTIVVAIALVTWPPVARLVRAEFLTLKQREFVQAARVAGQSDFTIIVVQVLPNALSPVIVMASLMVATAILMESGLGFLGLGDPNYMTWGYMIGAARTILRHAWWVSFFPGFAILLTVLALNLVGDGLNDALNPRLARKGR